MSYYTESSHVRGKDGIAQGILTCSSLEEVIEFCKDALDQKYDVFLVNPAETSAKGYYDVQVSKRVHPLRLQEAADHLFERLIQPFRHDWQLLAVK